MSEVELPKERVSATSQNQSPVPPSDGEEIDLRELFQKLNRHRLVIVGFFLLMSVITWLYVSQIIPQYTATTSLVLDFRKTSILNLEEVYTGGRTTPATLGTELEIIRSTSLLERVVDQLDLARNPEFNPALAEVQDVGHIQEFKAWIKAWFKGLWPEKADDLETTETDSAFRILEELSPEERELLLRRNIVGVLQEGLQTENRRNSYIITISYTSRNPQMAALMANTVAKMYINDQLEAKFETTRQANDWLIQRLDGLRLEVQAAEQAVKNVRQQSGMIQTRAGTLLEQQVSDVNAQLIQARLKRSRAEAALSQAKSVMESGGLEALSSILDSGSITQLRAEEASLRGKRTEMSQRYGPRHPMMIQVDAEIRDVQDKVNEETVRILKSLENDVLVARAEEQSLVQSLNRLRTDVGKAMEAELELMELERQAESSRRLYENYLGRFQEIRQHDELQRPDARIISPAEVPSAPSYPRKGLTMGMGMAAGLMFGVMGAFLLEALDRGFRTAEQLERATGLPVLGMIPAVARRKGFPDEYVLDKPHSAIAEALRGVRTAVHLCNVDKPPKTVMVTSSMPMEGKSTLCLSMGHLTALSGVKVLLIDADLRRAALTKRVTIDSLPNARLEDVLLGEAELQDALVVDKVSGLHLILAKGRTASAGVLLGSQRMADLLQNLSETYDLVLIDTPPVMGVADAWSLARSVDALVYVVRWSETPREMVRSALNQMKNLDIKVRGIVMTQVDVRQQARYGYGGYGYFYGKYKKYYQE
ncbi:MAG: polysaccharide biosynthesis tyrosine autokinase [Desulfovibrionales bacterium]|nr:MAG: polysaccharide biosynthesis tyrosine autokinase [Desulfovibrionales bacterium]